MAATTRKITYWAGGLVLISAALVYLLTLDNGLRPDELTGGDLITHQYAQVEARPSNAPGYPLYTMGGWLWFRLGRILLGWTLSPIQILSLYSTLWSLASLFVFYLILRQVTHGRWPLAMLLTAFYATTYFFWYYSVTTEQYTSAVFQTLLVIWLAFRWDESPRDSLLLWLAFISGTMLANMVTTLFILGPLLWFIFFRPGPPGGQRFFWMSYFKRPKFMLLAIGLALLPLMSYAYVYIRGAQHPEWRGVGQWKSTWAWFVQFLTIQQGRDELAPGLTGQGFFTDEFPALMWQELTWLVFWGGLFGLAFLERRRAIFLYSTLAIYFFFSWGYRFGNWFQVIIPAYPIFVIGFGAGLTKIIECTGQRYRGAARQDVGKQSVIGHASSLIVYSLVILLLAALLIYRFTTSLPRANQANLPTDTGLDAGWAMLADRPATPAVIFGDFAERVALEYLVTVWGMAPHVFPADVGELNPPLSIDEDETKVYFSRRAVAAAPEAIQYGVVHPQAAGEQLVTLWSTPRTELPRSAIPLDIAFGHPLKLVGWEQIETDYPLPAEVTVRLQRSNWQIALYWQAEAQAPADYTVSVRPMVRGQLITEAGERLIQDHQPVWGIYPTSRWRTDEIVRDVYTFSLPEEVTPEAVQIVVYQTTAAGFENLVDAVIYLE